MNHWVAPVVALALVSVSVSANGTSSRSSIEEQTAPTEVETIFKQYFDELYGRRFDKALALTRDLHPDADNRSGTAILDGMQAAALLGLKRDSEAKRLISEAERLAPEEPFPTTTIFEGSLIADRFDFAADALDKLIARFPDVARDQSPELVSYFLSKEPTGQEQRNEDRRVALARIGFGGSANGDWLAAGAVDILMKRGDTGAASDLLIAIDEPQTIENMLVQRRYSALWPIIEERAGTHLAKVRASSLTSAEQDYLKAPDNHEKLQTYINALRHSGRLDDAIALRSRLPATREAMAKVDEQLGWAVNNVALALHESGRAGEADELFAMLNDAPVDSAGWRVSMIINRLELLVGDGKFDKAATLLDATERSAKNDGNDYARQLVRRLKYCTLRSLGRREEAAKALPELMAHAADAPQPTIEGFLCAGDIDKAEQVELQMLSDPKSTPAKQRRFEETFVRALQPVPLTSDDPSVWANRLAMLRQRPAVAAAYARLGRDMPADYLPVRAK
jgi:tetratricopeptide (TPR) repeat protein